MRRSWGSGGEPSFGRVQCPQFPIDAFTKLPQLAIAMSLHDLRPSAHVTGDDLSGSVQLIRATDEDGAVEMA